jgi:hypothetical protein
MRKSLLVALLLGSLAVVGLGAPVGALGVGDANQAACPNEALEGFREYLADCRGYEMVTPPLKNGYAVGVVAVSGDGSRVLGQATGGFAGAGSNSAGEGSFYEFVRSGSGWATSALNPPAAQFTTQSLATVSDDFQRTLWIMHGSSQSVYADDLYVREGDGSFVLVGPMVPPAAVAGSPAGSTPGSGCFCSVVGASSDLSHILFSQQESVLFWPGDTTVRETSFGSLYEYVGTGDAQPALVGVSDGDTVVNGVTLPAGSLISDCGISLGSRYQNDSYNAVSASGETVFFTAGKGGCEGAVTGPSVDELYARLGGVQTVAVSEPTPAQCEACSTSARAPAVFQGASEDGSKAFFLTEQELLPEATGMNLYEYDFDSPPGEKIVRVSADSGEAGVQAGVLGVARVSDDGSHVYFVATGALTGANAEGAAPVLGGDNLYVFERDAVYPAGRLAFVGTLAEADAQDWSSEDVRPVQATPDGRFLVFDSAADLTPRDVSSEPQVFEYDAQTERLVRVSVGANGYPAGTLSADERGAFIPRQLYQGQAAKRPAVASALAVSADGSVVAFDSVGGLTPGAEVAAAAGAVSVYEYRSAGSIADGDVYLVSDGQDTTGAGQDTTGTGLVGIDPSGGDVFFDTYDPLVSQDVDTQTDVYDARVDGGFPAAVAPSVCEGEACQGAPGVSPSFVGPGSVSGVGGGNLPPPPPPSSGPVGGGSPKARPLTRAQRLSGALRVCRRERRRRERVVCEARARRRFGKRFNSGRKGGR